MVQYEELIKRIFKLYPFILFLFVFLFIFIHLIYSIFYPVFIGENKQIYIKPGEKTYLIAQKLEKEKVIRSAFYFKFLVNLRSSKIKAGIYEFNGFYNLLDVIKILEKGGKGIKITITEGTTLKEVENLFAKNGLKVEFSKYKIKDFSDIDVLKNFPQDSNLEGFLAPDTYEFFPSSNEREIIKEILNNFSKKYFTELNKGEDFSLYERLILASIVEKEAKSNEDFPIIAGILIKRLKNNWQLQADATLVYEKCGYVFCDLKLTKEDLKKDSPYNTYKNKGLPPTPITNPGILAIKSVINPIQTDYWYYLTNSEGKAIFSKTLKEHSENIKKYLKNE